MDTSNACRQGNTTRTLLITTALGLLLAHGAVAQYSGGGGVDGNPYRISTVSDLINLSIAPWDWHRHFRMTQDIDMVGVTGFTPIGIDEGNPFTGVFDGDGHVIHNLVIDLPEQDRVGLFGFIVTPEPRDAGRRCSR